MQPTPYTASCNPARRAKQGQVYTMPEDDEAPVSPPRRGRKPGTISRSAREAQRRLNHSMIEKARRTKINDALASLKELVPPDAGREQRDASESSTSRNTAKREEKEKEFKLEILVRTVSYMHHLLDRVAELEANQAATHAPPSCSCGSKRKRSDVDSPSLPSISSWLPDIPTPVQLPSPPGSTHFSPVVSATGGALPPLLLASPNAGLRHPGPASPEDQSAASMLLQISGSNQLPRAAMDIRSPLPRTRRTITPKSSLPHTPSSMLGMHKQG